MWAPLQDPVHVNFYKQIRITRSYPGEDWQPMIQLIRDIQALPLAGRLTAFTSHYHFHITTAPDYAACDGHRYVRITWDWVAGVARLSSGTCDEGWADALPYETYPPDTIVSAVSSLLERFIH